VGVGELVILLVQKFREGDFFYQNITTNAYCSGYTPWTSTPRGRVCSKTGSSCS